MEPKWNYSKITSRSSEFLLGSGRGLGVVNHTWHDRQGRTWISVMTRSEHWYDKLQDRNPDGYLILIDLNGARIVADGPDLTNEVKVSPDGRNV
jgi:hypothetical protein